jgi:hypothetical protein
MAARKKKARKPSGNKPRSKPAHLWKPGQSGNPSGRPKKSRELEEAIQKALENPDGTNFAVKSAMQIARDGDPREVLEALKLLMAYGYGRPKQRVEADVEGQLGVFVTVSYADD